MADLSLLIGRGSAQFCADGRFDTALPDDDAAARPPLPDVVAEARAAGMAEGRVAGRAAALAEAASAEGFREKLCLSFARLDAELAETLRQRLLDTVVALCEASLAPLALDREALAKRVTRAAALFARADDERVIRLNPEDLAEVRDLLPTDWSFTADPALERGALRVETATGGAEDGPEQWRRAIAEALDLC